MSQPQNPLSILGDYTWADWQNFKSHLRLPTRYLRVVFRNYKKLTDAVVCLPSLLRMTNDHDWEKLMTTSKVTLEEKIFRTANIPPMFFADRMIFTLSAAEQVDFEWLIDNIEQIKGETFYFYSNFSEGAMAAAFAIAKSAKLRMVSCYCTSFPELIADMKEGWDTKSQLQTHVRNDEVVVIYAVGCEYTTEYTQNLLGDIIRSRRENGYATILCSSLTPRDYVARYKCHPEGVEIGFRDEKIKKTLAQLKAEIGG